MLAIKLCNSCGCKCAFDAEGLLKSTKESEWVGIKSAFAFLKKYNGMLHFLQEGDVFIIQIVMKI